MILETEIWKYRDAVARMRQAWESLSSAARYTDDPDLRSGIRADMRELAAAIEAADVRIAQFQTLRRLAAADDPKGRQG